MCTSLRRLPALLALVALLLTLAEGAWASTCADDMPMDGSAAMSSGADAGMPGMPGMSAEAQPSSEPGDAPAPEPGVPECPLAAFVSTGVCAVPAFTAPAEFTLALFGEAAAEPSLAPEDVPSLLLAAGFFRPPRA